MVGCSLLQTSDRSQKATELVFLLEFSTSIPVFPRATAAFFPHLLTTHFPQNGEKQTSNQAAVQNSPSLGPTVENSHVGNHQMHVKIRTGLLEGRTNVCPAIDDWDAKDD